MNESEERTLQGVIPGHLHGWRLDQALASLFADFSRSRLQDWIRAGRVELDGRGCRPRERVCGGQQVSLRIVPEAETRLQGEDLPLQVLYADGDLLVIDKPAGIVVHPAVGNPAGTLVNALLHHFPELARLPRAGLVHRLDKNTSGLLVIARSERAHTTLVRQLQARSMSREYLAVAQGVLLSGGTIDAPLGRHPVDRKRIAVIAGGRRAVTHYRVLERYPAHTLLRVQLETGRTHQIRVHFAHIRHPLVGDPSYGGRFRLAAGIGEPLRQALRAFPRQALHARRLALVHPAKGERLEWQSSPPADLAALIAALRVDAGTGQSLGEGHGA